MKPTPFVCIYLNFCSVYYLRWPTTVTAKEITSPQKKTTHGKGRTFRLKEKDSRITSKNNLTAKEIIMSSRRKREPWGLGGFFFRRESCSFCCEVVKWNITGISRYLINMTSCHERLAEDVISTRDFHVHGSVHHRWVKALTISLHKI